MIKGSSGVGKRKHEILALEPAGSGRGIADAMLAAARTIAARVNISRIIIFADGIDRVSSIQPLLDGNLRLILVVRGHDQARQLRDQPFDVLVVPSVRLSRIDQVKMAVLFALSQGLLDPQEQFIALVGLAGSPVDSLMVIRAGRAWEIVHSAEMPLLGSHIRPDVFQRVMHIAINLAAEGREGKPIGVLIVLGDIDRVLRHADQMILNPFHGYSPPQRDIMDDALLETIREFAILDGAFLIRGEGQIESAGVYLRPAGPGEPLPPGLGARHATAAGITATTSCLAVTISESTGIVRLWRGGRIITEIKRAPGFMPDRSSSMD